MNKLTFVGSTAVGKRVMAAAAPNLTPVVLELGGKDPFVVCDDADLEQVVSIAMRGAFQGSGQNCAGAERFYVQESIYTDFVDRVVGGVNKMRVGAALEKGESEVDMGAVCMPTHVDHLQVIIFFLTCLSRALVVSRWWRAYLAIVFLDTLEQSGGLEAHSPLAPSLTFAIAC